VPARHKAPAGSGSDGEQGTGSHTLRGKLPKREETLTQSVDDCSLSFPAGDGT